MIDRSTNRRPPKIFKGVAANHPALVEGHFDSLVRKVIRADVVLPQAPKLERGPFHSKLLVTIEPLNPKKKTMMQRAIRMELGRLIRGREHIITKSTVLNNTGKSGNASHIELVVPNTIAVTNSVTTAYNALLAHHDHFQIRKQ